MTAVSGREDPTILWVDKPGFYDTVREHFPKAEDAPAEPTKVC